VVIPAEEIATKAQETIAGLKEEISELVVEVPFEE
jgi:hypothetical protein